MAEGFASLLRSEIDLRRSGEGLRSGDASTLGAARGEALSDVSFDFEGLVESFRLRIDRLLPNFARDGLEGSCASFWSLDLDFGVGGCCLVGEGEREFDLDPPGTHDLRFNFLARDEPVAALGLAALEEPDVDVVRSTLLSTT